MLSKAFLGASAAGHLRDEAQNALRQRRGEGPRAFGENGVLTEGRPESNLGPSRYPGREDEYVGMMRSCKGGRLLACRLPRA